MGAGRRKESAVYNNKLLRGNRPFVGGKKNESKLLMWDICL